MGGDPKTLGEQNPKSSSDGRRSRLDVRFDVPLRPRLSFSPFTLLYVIHHSSSPSSSLSSCSTRRFVTLFPFLTRLDVSSSSSSSSSPRRRRCHQNTCYPRVTARWGRPLTAVSRLRLTSFTVFVLSSSSSSPSSSTHVKSFLPSCDRPSGPSPNGGPTSCV
jgi:hypothetical protein